MSGSHTSWMWPVTVMVTAVSLALAVFAGSIYDAFGEQHDTTFYACLYAGSLSQVSTTPPANCGRGALIQWNAVGPAGPEGPQGPAGEPATALWAVVDAEGDLVRHSGAVSASLLDDVFGDFEVIFGSDVSGCAYVATAGQPGDSEPMEFGVAAVRTAFGNPNGVYIQMFNADGDQGPPRGFHLAVFCPGVEPADGQ